MQIKLYYYEHCPYCVRVLMLINIKSLDVETIVLANDDEAGPIGMIGKKMAPILQKEDGNFMAESLDIIEYLDQLGDPIIAESGNVDEIQDWLDSVAELNRFLVYPRMVQYPFAEFASESSRAYFINKKSDKLGPFAKAIEHTQQYMHELAPYLDEVDKLVQSLDGEVLSYGDIMLFPVLRNMTLVKGINFSLPVTDYLRKVSDSTNLPLFEQD